MEIIKHKEYKKECPVCQKYLVPLGRRYFCTDCGDIYKNEVEIGVVDEEGGD